VYDTILRSIDTWKSKEQTTVLTDELVRDVSLELAQASLPVKI